MRQIPRVPPTENGERREFDGAVKERLEVISGLRGGKITPLDPATATTYDCAVRLNLLLALLQ